MQPTALLVDDEADLCKLMQMTLAKMDVKSDIAYDLRSAYELFDNNDYDFCLTDLALPDGSGLDMVKKIVNSDKQIPIAVITAHGNSNLAIEALKLGAFDFVNKPLEVSRLRQLASSALKVTQSSQIDATTNHTVDDILLSKRLIGNSEPIQQLRQTIKKLAKSQAPVFLWGASGTGKEVVAKLIHDLSPRKDGNFVPVNCGAIPSELMESEFFGHKKGSFTGATTDKIGLFQQANGGTLFLDEVADLPLAMQVKLLRAIQEKTVRAIGDTKEVPVDIRILSATHKDLAQLVAQGDFRQDLFYRINVIMVKLPKLNQRRQDIPLLAQHFLTLIAQDWQIDTPTLSDDALNHLQSHDFEGNVRELRNLLERAVTMTDNNLIGKEHLFGEHTNPNNPHHHRTPTPSPTSTPATPTNTPYQNNTPVEIKLAINYQSNPTMPIASGMTNSKVLIDDDSEFVDKAPSKPKKTPKPNPDSLTLNVASLRDIALPREGLEAYLQNQEKVLILAALERTGSKTHAAKLLGMSFRSLRYRMKKLELDGGDD